MEIPELEFMSVTEFEKANVLRSWNAPWLGRAVFEIDDGSRQPKHWIFDSSSDGYGRLVRVRFDPERNFLSIWW